MSWAEWFPILRDILTIVVFPVVYFIWRNVREVRENELQHIHACLVRVETKLDQHLLDHAK